MPRCHLMAEALYYNVGKRAVKKAASLPATRPLGAFPTVNVAAAIRASAGNSAFRER